MTNCLEVLAEEGESLRGYSADTLALLSDQSLPAEECESLLALYEAIYG